jgi:hypothetical protein
MLLKRTPLFDNLGLPLSTKDVIMADYNVGAIWVDAISKYERTVAYPKINEQQQKLESINEQLADLTKLLQVIHKEKDKKTPDKKKRVDLNSSPETIKMVDKVRENSKLSFEGDRAEKSPIIDEHCYTWEGEETINALITSLNEESKRLGNYLSPCLMHMTEHFGDLHHIIEAGVLGNKAGKDEIAHTLENMRR